MRRLFVIFGHQAIDSFFPSPILDWRSYIIDMGDFRSLYGSVGFSFEGRLTTLTDRARKLAMTAIYGAIESKMTMGETIFLRGDLTGLSTIDSPDTLTTKDVKGVIRLARAYDYTVHLVDAHHKNSPNPTDTNSAFDGVWEQKPDRKIMRGWVNMHDIAQILTVTPHDLSEYERIVLVGDIQGAGDELQELIAKVPGGLDSPHNFWIFVGDLFDRGTTPVTVYNTLLPERKNVVIVQGNHEIAVRRASLGTFNYDKPDDTIETLRQLEEAGITKRAVREELINRSVPFFAFTVGAREHWVSHGGVIPAVLDAVTAAPGRYVTGLLADEVLCRGTNNTERALYGKTNYRVFADELDTACARRGIVQWFGHRHEKRMEGMSPLDFEAIRPLESGVEHRGGFLTAVMLSNNGAVETLIRVPSTSTVKPFR